MMKKITVVVPCYNVESFIERTIQSFKRQTFKDFSVIFVDDCSTDNSFEVVKQLIEKYQIDGKVIKNEKNSGPSFSRLNGINNSESDYLAFCDSDDWYDDVYLEEMYNHCENSSKDIVLCNFRLVYNDGKTIEKTAFSQTDNITDKVKLTVDVDSMCCCLIRRSLFDNLVFPEFRNGEDMAIIPVLLSRANEVAICDKYIYNYYQRSGSLSNKQTTTIINSLVQSFEYIYENLDINSYYDEVEYLGIRNLVYGALLNVYKQGYNSKKAKQILSDFNNKFPNWKNNKYISKLPVYKKVFVKLASLDVQPGLYMLSNLHTILTK